MQLMQKVKHNEREYQSVQQFAYYFIVQQFD
jgi:thiosulfate reductase cytochrome b subunit